MKLPFEVKFEGQKFSLRRESQLYKYQCLFILPQCLYSQKNKMRKQSELSTKQDSPNKISFIPEM